MPGYGGGPYGGSPYGAPAGPSVPPTVVSIFMAGSRTRDATLETGEVLAIFLAGTRDDRDGGLCEWEQIFFPPENDPFATPDTLSAAGGIVDFDLTYATTQGGEPNFATLGPLAAANTLWYSFTAPFDGELSLQTGPTNGGVGPYIATLVGVYTGVSLGTLVVVAEGAGNADYDPDGDASLLVVALTAGEQVFVRIGANPTVLGAFPDDDTINDEYAVGPGTLTWSYQPTAVLPTPTGIANPDEIPTPGPLSITLGNLPPSVDVEFTLDLPTALTFDGVSVPDTGALTNFTVMIPTALAAGGHTLFGVLPDGSYVAVPFIADADNPPDVEDPDVPPVLIPRSGVQRWIFQDPTGTHAPNGSASFIVPINPNKMDTPFPVDKAVSTQATVGIPGRQISWEENPTPAEWSFSGVVIDGDPRSATSHLSMLTYFAKLPYLIYVIDHFNRAWTVYLTSMKFTPAQTVQHMFRHTYEAHAFVYAPPAFL